MATPPEGAPQLGSDEALLAELGYNRSSNAPGWIYELRDLLLHYLDARGLFYDFFAAWNNGGPVMVAIGWPVVGGLILVIALCMAEICSSMPTAGGIYYWASKLGGPSWGWFTGWMNLVGLLAWLHRSTTPRLVCLVHDRPVRLELQRVFADQHLHHLHHRDLICTRVHQHVPGAHPFGLEQRLGVLACRGPAIAVLILIFAPDSHQSPSFVFTHWVNNSGFDGGSTSSLKFFLYVVPLGVILTQYTITGFDASAHLSEETTGAAKAAAQGMWRSVFYSWIFGWIRCCASCSRSRTSMTSRPTVYGAGSSIGIFAGHWAWRGSKP